MLVNFICLYEVNEKLRFANVISDSGIAQHKTNAVFCMCFSFTTRECTVWQTQEKVIFMQQLFLNDEHTHCKKKNNN